MAESVFLSYGKPEGNTGRECAAAKYIITVSSALRTRRQAWQRHRLASASFRRALCSFFCSRPLRYFSSACPLPAVPFRRKLAATAGSAMDVAASSNDAASAAAPVARC